MKSEKARQQTRPMLLRPADLRAWREQLGLFQYQAAEEAGMDRVRVTLFEKRLPKPVLMYLQLIETYMRLEQAKKTPEEEPPHDEIIAA